MRLWTTARVPAARLNVNPTNDAGGPAPSTQRAGRTVNPYCLAKDRMDLAKDRMDLTGARWGLDGAEAILELRAIHSQQSRTHCLYRRCCPGRRLVGPGARVAARVGPRGTMEQDPALSLALVPGIDVIRKLAGHAPRTDAQIDSAARLGTRLVADERRR